MNKSNVVASNEETVAVKTRNNRSKTGNFNARSQNNFIRKNTAASTNTVQVTPTDNNLGTNDIVLNNNIKDSTMINNRNSKFGSNQFDTNQSNLSLVSAFLTNQMGAIKEEPRGGRSPLLYNYKANL